MAKKNFFKTTSKVVGRLAMVLALVFGLVLAGCDDPNKDPDPDPSPGNATVKLAQAGENKFTLTVTGQKWRSSGPSNSTIMSGFLELDGPVTAEGVNTGNPKIISTYSIAYSVERTSDTVLTYTMSQRSTSSEDPPNFMNFWWGSGKLKMKSSVGISSYFEDFNVDCTIASDSESVSFNIPKHQ